MFYSSSSNEEIPGNTSTASLQTRRVYCSKIHVLKLLTTSKQSHGKGPLTVLIATNQRVVGRLLWRPTMRVGCCQC